MLVLTTLALAAPLQVDALSADDFDAPRFYDQITPDGVVAVGDLNGDGLPDMVARRLASFPQSITEWASVSAWTNQGGREFFGSGFQAIPNPPDATERLGFFGSYIADFTGDSFADYATSYEISPGSSTLIDPFEVGIRVYPGAGDGSLGAAIDFAVPNGKRIDGFFAADIDNDGVHEVAILARDFNFDTFLGWGELTGGQVVIAAPKTPLTTFQELHGGDFDGDGVPDLVMLRNDGLELRLFRTVGGSSLSNPLAVPVPPIGLNDNLAGLVTGEFTGDSDNDVLLLRPIFPGNNYEVLVFPGTGTGLSASPISSVPEASLNFLVLELWGVDWDLDGDRDLMINDLQQRVLANDGSGNFTWDGTRVANVPGSIPIGQVGVGSVGPVDIDLDGFADCSTWDGVFYGNGRFGADTLQGATFEGPGTVPAEVLDVDDDGDLDYLVNDNSPFGSGDPIEIYSGDGSGAFAEVPYGLGTDADSGLPYEELIARGDFDGDGVVEWLAVDRAVDPLGNPIQGDLVLLEANGVGEFVETGPGGPPKLFISPPVGDVWPTGDADGDGDLDLFVTGGVHLNIDGNGLFFGFVPCGFGPAADVLDWDADGDSDVLSFDGQDLVLYRNQGGLLFVPEVLDTMPEVNASIDSLDWQSDGDLDRAVTAHGGGWLRLLVQEPGGYVLGPLWSETSLIGLSVGGVPVAMSDVDGSGDEELLMIRRFQRPGFSIQNFAAVVLEETIPGLLEERASWLVPSALLLDDLDGDGDQDLHGSAFLRGNGYSGAAGGGYYQFGEGAPGTGGVVPLFGLNGPYHVDSTAVTTQLRFGVGGGVAIYAVGTAEALLPAFPTPFITTYLDPLAVVALYTIPLSGAPGAAGAGEFDFTVSVQPFLTGLAFYEQVFVFDPGAPEQFSASNALFVQLGN